MRLAVDAHNLLNDRRGIGVYLRALLARLLARSDVEITLLVRELFPRRLHGAIARELGNDAFRIARSVPRSCDLLWHPWNGRFFRAAIPEVATIHDCVPFAFPNPDPRRRRSEQQPFLDSARRARRIITDSVFSRNEIVRYLGRDEETIDAIALSADARFTPGEPQWLPQEIRGRRYLLYVGPDDPRKNLRTLWEAWNEACAPREIALVCVGAQASGAITLRNLSTEQLRDLYRGAWCFAFPSYYEGFGLPPLEAMACGAAVIMSRASSLPEVGGDVAAYVDQPQSADAWTRSLLTFIENDERRRQTAIGGPAQAARFSWDRCAQETYDAFARALTPMP